MKIILFGMIIGVANIIPGVSGGTMAVILNVYDKIISSISNLRTDFKNSLKFLIPIGIGAVAGIVLFAKIIEFCLTSFPSATNLVFIGLILGSIPMIKKKTDSYKKSGISIFCFILMFLLMIAMNFSNINDSASVMTVLNLQNFIKLFSASFISAGAMIIPGISGSFIMLLLGIYGTVLTAVSDLNVVLLIPVALGCGLGILVCAKAIDILFKNYPCQTYMGILGLMCGSIIVIAPNFSMNLEFIVGIVLCIIASVGARSFSKE